MRSPLYLPVYWISANEMRARIAAVHFFVFVDQLSRKHRRTQGRATAPPLQCLSDTTVSVWPLTTTVACQWALSTSTMITARSTISPSGRSRLLTDAQSPSKTPSTTGVSWVSPAAWASLGFLSAAGRISSVSLYMSICLSVCACAHVCVCVCMQCYGSLPLYLAITLFTCWCVGFCLSATSPTVF